MNQTRLTVASLVLAAGLAGASALLADTTEPRKNNAGSSSSRDKNFSFDDLPATDPAYKLCRGDEIAITVFNEGDMSSSQKIDKRGIIKIIDVGEVLMEGRTVRDSEAYLEKLFIDKDLLKKPSVRIDVRGYASHEISVFGAVNGAGKFRIEPEKASVEILDVVMGMGGFRPTAKSNDVKVTRTLDSGEEKVISVDVEAMMNPRKADRNTPRSFLVYPGDRIFVAEKLW